MEMKIKLVAFIKCEPKGKKPYTRVDYYCTDTEKMINSPKFKGRLVVPMFFDGVEVFDKLPITLIGNEVIAVLETKDNPRNPMKPYVKTSAFKTKDGIIDLL